MKAKLITLTMLLGSFLAANAQTSNAIFFTENGERFNVVLNGILQNEKPETNVKLTDLNAPSYKVRVLFEDKALGYTDFNLNFMQMGAEVTYTVKKNNKGAYVVRYVSEVPLAQAPPSAPGQTVVVYSATSPVSTTTTRQTTTTTTGNPENVSINMGVNAGGEGGNIHMNVSGMNGQVESTSTTTTTTTYSTTTSTQYDEAPAPATVIYVDGYNGKIGCPVPMSRNDFESFKTSMNSKSFEDSKMTMAKQVLNNNCFTSAQVREVMGMFSFEESKLDFAKYAYGHTYDVGNYFKVNDAFGFESSIEELNEYISSHR